MIRTFILALAVLASSPAHAGGWECSGKVVSINDGGALLIWQNDTRHDDCVIEDKAIVRRVLKVCPAGSQCELWLGDDHPRRFYTRRNSNRGLPETIVSKPPLGIIRLDGGTE